MARTLAVLVAVLSLSALATPPPHKAPKPVPAWRRNHIEICDGMLIKARAHGENVVTLFERKELQLPSMITTPRRFRSELLDSP